MFITIKTNLSVKMTQISSKTIRYYNFWTIILEIQFLMNNFCHIIITFRLEYLNSTPPPWSGGGISKTRGKWSGVEVKFKVQCRRSGVEVKTSGGGCINKLIIELKWRKIFVPSIF
jgi:hypothetical protein